MRYIRYACIAIFGLALVAIALANRGIVQLQLLPGEVAGAFQVAPSIELPLFVVIYGAIMFGLLAGFVWEWVREYGQRAEAARVARDKRRLEREVKSLKAEKHGSDDPVLAMLEEPN